MPYNPGVSFFIDFQDLDPSAQRQCIFFTQKGARCRYRCDDRDNKRAIELYETINTQPAEDITLEQLQEYILCNCCGPGRARHQDRIEDIELLTSLAERWQSEIQSLAQSLQATQQEPNSAENQSHYNLRSSETDSTVVSSAARAVSAPRVVLSEFRPHKARPGPGDCVYQKFLDPLQDRDFETGSLYIFDRNSSPGHVKIGWTAVSIEGRLESWSRCGYTPNLLFKVSNVPYSQRVETLTHHELIKEWRRERMCKAPWCRKSHQEWFEVSTEKASQILGDWADFMTRAEPYEINGHLKLEWRYVIEEMNMDGEPITGTKLLEYYEMVLAAEIKDEEEQIDLEHAPKLEDPEVLPQHKSVPDTEHTRKANSQDALPISTELLENYPSTKSEVLLTEPRLSVKLSSGSLEFSDKESSLGIKLKSEPSLETSTVVQEELRPEQIPLPPSPLLQPLEPPGDHASPQELRGTPTNTTSKSKVAHNKGIESEDVDEVTLLDVEPTAAADEWDGDETLIEEAQMSLHTAALKVVDVLESEILASKVNKVANVVGGMKSPKELQILETRSVPAMPISAQA